METTALARRDFLARFGTGLGSLGLGSLLSGDRLLAAPPSPLAARPGHFPARAAAEPDEWSQLAQALLQSNMFVFLR